MAKKEGAYSNTPQHSNTPRHSNTPLQDADLKYARDGEIFELDTVELKVRQLQEIAGRSIVEIGRLLAWTKERVAHGEFAGSLERIGMNHSTANAYMKIYAKLQKVSNSQPVANLGISKAIELVRNYEEEELEALASGEEVEGHTLDELSEMSRTELQATLRSEREEHGKKLEASRKQADALQQRNDKLAQQMERRESGSDGGWEFCAQWLDKMGAQAMAAHSAAMQLERLASDWHCLIEGGDERALAGHPFILSNVAFYQNLIGTAVDQCDGALQQAMAADHPDLEYPPGTQYAAMGFSRNNLPKDMQYTPKAVEEAEPQYGEDEIPFGPEFEELKPNLA